MAAFRSSSAVPGTQGVQTVLPGALYDPTAQGWHGVVKSPSWSIVPAGQSAHVRSRVAFAATAMYPPRAHCVRRRQVRSLVAVAGVASYWSLVQRVRATQTRFESTVGGTTCGSQEKRGDGKKVCR